MKRRRVSALVSVYIFTLVTFLCQRTHGRLGKRIVGGDKIKRRDPSIVPYNSVQYFVWIGNGHSCDRSKSWWDRFAGAVVSKHCAPRPDVLMCGGALITPKIVQTACHCVSEFVVTGTDLWYPAKAWQPWERRCEIYMGLNRVSDFEFNLFPAWFLVHQKCSKLSLAQSYISHDYGWIYLDFTIQDSFINVQNYFLNYAPLYKLQTLNELYTAAVTKELVCLIVGFGLKSLDMGERRASNTMKHAWIGLMSENECFYWTVTWRNVTGRFDYGRYNSWACAAASNHIMGGFHANGDSGGPVTCNNNYFAVISGHWNLPHKRKGVSVLLREDPIKYAEKESAAEYRQAFIDEMDNYQWEKAIDDELRRLHPKRDTNVFRADSYALEVMKIHNTVSSAQPRVFKCWFMLARCILSLVACGSISLTL